jgi:hypothetical protein
VRRQPVTLADGRYLIFYTFEDADTEPDAERAASHPPADPRAPVEDDV